MHALMKGIDSEYVIHNNYCSNRFQTGDHSKKQESSMACILHFCWPLKGYIMSFNMKEHNFKVFIFQEKWVSMLVPSLQDFQANSEKSEQIQKF